MKYKDLDEPTQQAIKRLESIFLNSLMKKSTLLKALKFLLWKYSRIDVDEILEENENMENQIYDLKED